MDYRSRQKLFRGFLRQHRLDALLITHLPNIRYLCGFTGSAGALLVGESDSIFFSDGRYTSQAHVEVQNAKIKITRSPSLPAAAGWLQTHSRSIGQKIGIEAEHLTVSDHQLLRQSIPQKFHLRSAPSLVEQCRMVKDSEELKRIRAAVNLGALLFDRALEVIRPGVRETEVASEMEYVATKKGAEGMSFPTIIASGERSALPHGKASDARIPSKGFVVCDFGVILGGYCSDQTRTVSVGRVPEKARKLYKAVLEAQQAALDAVRPGKCVAEVDRAARNMLRKAGLGRYFTHSTGHGVGLEIHEAPRVADGQKEILRPGMVITIEPGV